MQQVPMNHGDEIDAFTRARKFHFWKPGQLKKIKRGYNKRARKTAKHWLNFMEVSEVE